MVVAVQRQVRALWPRLSRVLTTTASVEVFIPDLRAAAEKAIEAEIDPASGAPPIEAAQPNICAGLCESVSLKSSSMAAGIKPVEEPEPPEEALMYSEVEPASESSNSGYDPRAGSDVHPTPSKLE